jgi:hypothetical protein
MLTGVLIALLSGTRRTVSLPRFSDLTCEVIATALDPARWLIVPNGAWRLGVTVRAEMLLCGFFACFAPWREKIFRAKPLSS